MPSATTFRRSSSGAIAGIAAAGAYLLAQAADIRLFGHPADDRLLIGRLLTGNNDAARTIGTGLHLVNGAVAGVAYTLVAEPVLPGPPLLRGVAFALAENTVLYPLALFEGRHPAVRDGSLPSYWTRTTFAQETLRHVAFGAVLGPVAAALRRSGEG